MASEPITHSDSSVRISELVPEALTAAQMAIVLWGVLGVLALLGQAIIRLGHYALEPLADGSLQAHHWVLYVGWCLMNAYLEGYRGFQKRFSPRVVGRALVLSRRPTFARVVFAPLFCMSFFHATRRGLIAAYGVLFAVLLAIVAVRQLPQPWRGIIDAGVVVGLLWGALAIVVFLARALAGRVPPGDPEIPGPEQRS